MSDAGYLELEEGAEPATPSANLHKIYVDTVDDKVKHKRPDGVVVSMEAGTGTVSSVALTAPPEFTVTGSPVTGAGTLAFVKASQNPNNVYAGPASGAAAVPTFRSLVSDDIPNLDSTKITTGSWAVNRGGTNSTTALNNNRIMQSAAGAIVEAPAITANKALQSDANGIPVASAVTNTELNYVAGVTSALQAQLNAKQASGNYITDLTGHVVANGPGAASATIQPGVVTNAMIASGAGIPYSKLALTAAIVNADIATSAAIAYSKLNLAASIVNTDVAAGAAIAYAKLALTNSLVNADVAAGAAIAYAKLNLSASILNADIATGAAIAYAKLNLTGSLVNADVAVAAAIAYSKLALTNSLVNADVAAGAAIAYSKLALTASIINADVATGAAIAYAKLNLSNSIVNTDIAAGAAIAYSKLNLTNSIANADIISGAAIAYSKLNLAASIVNSDIATGAAIAYAKLVLTNSIVNADVATGAAIAYAKLALTNGIVNADINSAAAIAYSKLALTNSIVNADVASGAAIDRSKLNDGTQIGPSGLDGYADLFYIKDVSAVTYNTIALKNISPVMNLKYHYVFSEDFNNGDLALAGGLQTTQAGTGSSVAPLAPIDNIHHGVIALTSGTTTTGRAIIYGGTASGLTFGNGQFTYETCVYIPTLSDGTDTYTLRFGYGDTTAGTESSNGLFFRYSSTENTGKWVGVARTNNVETVVNSTAAVTAGAWNTLRFVVNAAGTSVEFFLNDVSLGTVTSNIPVAVGRNSQLNSRIVKSAGTTSRNCYVDYINCYQSLTTAR